MVQLESRQDDGVLCVHLFARRRMLASCPAPLSKTVGFATIPSRGRLRLVLVRTPQIKTRSQQTGRLARAVVLVFPIIVGIISALVVVSNYMRCCCAW
jgi:hypothetical protein